MIRIYVRERKVHIIDQFAAVASNDINGCQTYLIFYLFLGNLKPTAHSKKVIN